MTEATTAPAPADVFGAAAGRLLHELDERVPRDDRKGDRGTLAILRRAAGKSSIEAHGAAAIVYRYVPAELSVADVEAIFTVATLFAIHPRDTGPSEGRRHERGIGTALRAIRWREESTDEDPGVERRFVALLNSSREALPEHLRHLVTLLQSRNENTAINYRQLARDIRDWDAVDRRVQRAWASGFWGYRATGEPTAAGPDSDTATDSDTNTDSDDD
ncbi:MAG: type I-E CRISPR-associated protein Cse2/CasB [Dehalococcoidia bacterium]|nr:type I-E CRISPR-associated protein Cse2/CasB [Dehalococcoidia bacterium]